jgi:DNA helicase II / ATP-dependent DNA helicase PcrA
MSATDSSVRSARYVADLKHLNLRLTDGQRRIVEMDDTRRHMLLGAPPGSGKTLTITRRVACLLERNLATPEQILALTFTERAASELASRLDSMTLPGVTAGTFHSRCSAILREHWRAARLAGPFVLWTPVLQREAIREAIEASGLPPQSDPALRNLLRALSAVKRERKPIDAVAGQTLFGAELLGEILERFS